VRPIRSQRAPHIDDPARRGIKADPQLISPAAQDEGDVVTGGKMLTEGGGKRQIGEDITIVDDERIIPREPIAKIVNSPGGIEEDGLVTKQESAPALAMLRKSGIVGLVAMVSVYRKLPHPEVVAQMGKRKGDQGTIENGDERLGQLVGERAQARAEAGSEDEGFTDCPHVAGKVPAIDNESSTILAPFPLPHQGEAEPCSRPGLFIPSVCGKRTFAPPSTMAYIINGKHIGDEILEDEFESIKEHYQSMGEVVCCDRDIEFRAYAKDNVINRTLLEQESVKRFGDISAEAVEARFEEIKAEHGDEQTFYDNTGFNPGDRRTILEKLKSSMIVDRLFDAELQLPAAPSAEELTAYYQENISRYMSGEQVRVSQIFIEPSSHEAAREAYLALRELRRELFAGKDFELAAREHGSSEDREIDLGFMKQGETMPEVEAITFSMEVGEISPIVATHYGFHLFKVTDRKDPAPIPQDEIPGLRDQYLQEKRAVAIEELINRLKAAGSIEEITEAPRED